MKKTKDPAPTGASATRQPPSPELRVSFSNQLRRYVECLVWSNTSTFESNWADLNQLITCADREGLLGLSDDSEVDFRELVERYVTLGSRERTLEFTLAYLKSRGVPADLTPRVSIKL